MAKYYLFKFLAVCCCTSVMCSCSAKVKTAEVSDFVFDTYAHISVCGKAPQTTAEEISDCFKELDEAFSLCYEKTAELLPQNTVYNDCTDKTLELSQKYGEGISVFCGELTALWGIATDCPKIPADDDIQKALYSVSLEKDYTETSMLDFGAVAKGYACDTAYKILKESNAEYSAVSLGSSTLLYGEKTGNKPFRAGVTNPDNPEGYLGVIETQSAFISTSGGYERFFEADGKRYSHILDMNTGRPVETDLSSVTVIVPSDTEGGGFLSDFLSTLIYIDGSENLDKWLSYEEFSLVCADVNGKVYTDFDGFTLDEESGYSYG